MEFETGIGGKSVAVHEPRQKIGWVHVCLLRQSQDKLAPRVDTNQEKR
jgi:hypothetical protein